MPFRALLMRFFLILALLANGPGMAGASMNMEPDSASADPVLTASQEAAEPMSDCHGALADAPAADEHHHEKMAGQAGTPSPLDDCCETDSCCACMHHCFAAFAGSASPGVEVLYRQIAEPFLSVHASAALTNLFRPPIG